MDSRAGRLDRGSKSSCAIVQFVYHSDMRFETVSCEVGDVVSVASISMEVVPGYFKVVKKGKNTVYLAPIKDPNAEPKPWHKTRVIKVHDGTENLEEQNEEEDDLVYDDDLESAIEAASYESVAAHASFLMQPDPSPVPPSDGPPIKRKRGRPPKPKTEAFFNLDAYLSIFGEGVELWVRSGKSTSANILIEPNRKVFWYFRTDPKTERPKKKFYLGDKIPSHIGRRFKLPNYQDKIAVLKSKGYIRRDRKG